MSYVTILWSAAAAVALLLALVHALVWVYDKRARANLAFAVAAFALAVEAITELGAMHATSAQEWGDWAWWVHASSFVLVCAIVLFLHSYLGAGRGWLLTSVIAMCGMVLPLNVVSKSNSSFQRIDSIEQMPFLGEQVTVLANTVTGDYQWFALLASVLLPLFIVDVVVTVWRRRTPAARRMALLVGAPVLAAMVLSTVMTQLVAWRVVELPMLVLPPFLIALAAMAIEVSRDAFRASRLAGDLRESEQRLELAANAELGAEGKLELVRDVVRDVTHRREAEDEVTNLRYQLAHAGRVTMLGQLSSSLAHELSQPLSAIQQNAEAAQLLLAREPVDLQQLRAIIDDVLRDDRRAAEVVHRLHAWLKQGRMCREAVVLHELTLEVIALVRPAAAAKQVTLECAVPCTLPPVLGDRVHLSQVLLNLIMNGIDAVVEASDAQPLVRIEGCAMANHCCEMSVTDTGPGIAPDQLDRIFEPFVTAKTEGMGMGLSISRNIVEAHGGKLWAENAARGGATFRFTVPVQ